MSISVLRNETPTARKEYRCNACEHLLMDGMPNEGDFTPDEWKHILGAKSNGWKINKGDKYMKQTNNYNGGIGTFRAIPEINNICDKHGYYDFD
jgi:hypothetical protein